MPGESASKPKDEKEPKEEPRPVPPPPASVPPEQQAKPPQLPADALSDISRRVSAVESKPPVQIGAGAVFALALLAGGLVIGIFASVAALLRRRRSKE